MLTRFARKAVNTVVLLAAFAGSSAVFAHAHLKSTTPAQDSTVSAPQELKLEFSEGIEAKFTKVTLTDAGGKDVPNSIATDPSDKKVLVVTPAKPLAAGEYTVQWHAVSVDAHKSEGHYSFKVGN
ncbi:copper homeostasis periplasmic binding protein CopC [Pseudomonas akapageensis]|uniref:copper homeostasis periplasmic binding protein CopC n=1 Tax=Pseudomonas akapageensis TaxID=2609961 RepID=UPI00140C1BD9|nr:copper homeostasis periplasmic binding protein CopC [Pseudomonas akapageensis]